MKLLSEKLGSVKLKAVREEFQQKISSYEERAESCATCKTPGACCLDEHFVNVRISKLEAVAIDSVLSQLHVTDQSRIYHRIEKAAEGLGSSDTFACPRYERGVGCLVHEEAKPLPCIQHACYRRREDLPPDALLDEAEAKVDRLN